MHQSVIYTSLALLSTLSSALPQTSATSELIATTPFHLTALTLPLTNLASPVAVLTPFFDTASISFTNDTSSPFSTSPTTFYLNADHLCTLAILDPTTGFLTTNPPNSTNSNVNTELCAQIDPFGAGYAPVSLISGADAVALGEFSKYLSCAIESGGDAVLTCKAGGGVNKWTVIASEGVEAGSVDYEVGIAKGEGACERDEGRECEVVVLGVVYAEA